MSTPAIVTMVVAGLLLGGGLLASVASAVRAERRDRRGATPPGEDTTAHRGASATGTDEAPGRSGGGASPSDPPADPTAGLPPQQPARGASTPTAPQLVADGDYDRTELQAFAEAQLPEVPAALIHDTLDLYDEHLMVRGIASVPTGHRWRFHDPAEVRSEADPVVDGEEIARQAATQLDVDAATVERILDVEFAYLQAKGLA